MTTRRETQGCQEQQAFCSSSARTGPIVRDHRVFLRENLDQPACFIGLSEAKHQVQLGRSSSIGTGLVPVLTIGKKVVWNQTSSDRYN